MWRRTVPTKGLAESSTSNWICWNINGISHNFIYHPEFRLPLLNRLVNLLESITLGFSQVFYVNKVDVSLVIYLA